jgi:hypothetical protein
VRTLRSWVVGFGIVAGLALGWSLYASADSVPRPDAHMDTSASPESSDPSGDDAAAPATALAAALPPAMPPVVPAAVPGALPATTPLGNPISIAESSRPRSAVPLDGSSPGDATDPSPPAPIAPTPEPAPDIAAPVPTPVATTPVAAGPTGSVDLAAAPRPTSDAPEPDEPEPDEPAAPYGDEDRQTPAIPTSPTGPSSPTSPGDPTTYTPRPEPSPTEDEPDDDAPTPMGVPPFIGAELFAPLPGAPSRAVSFSEWESYRSDVAGSNIMLTTDDSNLSVDRNGAINGNTGDTDASGLNIVDATDSVIHGSESADEAPYQTAAAALVDLASDAPGGGLGSDPDDSESDEEDTEDEEAPPPVPVPTPTPTPTPVSAAPTGPPATPAAPAATDPAGAPPAGAPPAGAPPTPTAPAGEGPAAEPVAIPPGTAVAAVTPAATEVDGDDGGSEEWDFPYAEWVQNLSRGTASAVHTDEGTTLASGADALVIGADGYDDDDNRAYGDNIVMTRDDGNVVLGGTGDVNSQIGDSEQGAVIMDVTRTFIQGGGAY